MFKGNRSIASDSRRGRGILIALCELVASAHVAVGQPTCPTDPPEEFLYGDLTVLESPVASQGNDPFEYGSNATVAIDDPATGAPRLIIAWETHVRSPGDQNYKHIFAAGFASDDGDCIHDPPAGLRPSGHNLVDLSLVCIGGHEP